MVAKYLFASGSRNQSFYVQTSSLLSYTRNLISCVTYHLVKNRCILSVSFLLAILALVSFAAGVRFAVSIQPVPMTPEPEVVYIEPSPELITQYIYVPHEEIVIVEETKIVEKIVERMIKPQYREFESPEALKAWAKKQPLLGKSGQEGFLNPDCDEWAEYYQRRMLADGYLGSMAIVDRAGNIGGTHVIDTGGFFHSGIVVFIGNDYYYLEPVTKEVVKIFVTRD